MPDTNDLTPPPATAEFQPAAPLKDTGVAFSSEPAPPAGRLAGARQTVSENTAKVREQATDRALGFAQEGKAKATGALTQLSQMLTDAAGTVDEKLGAQYGQYARSAADQVAGFTASVEAKSVDELVEDVRGLVRKSPAVAIGTAAALGFVVARLLTSGLDQRDAT